MVRGPRDGPNCYIAEVGLGLSFFMSPNVIPSPLDVCRCYNRELWDRHHSTIKTFLWEYIFSQPPLLISLYISVCLSASILPAVYTLCLILYSMDLFITPRNPYISLNYFFNLSCHLQQTIYTPKIIHLLLS